MGRADLENALQRLDKLTQEARIPVATAEVVSAAQPAIEPTSLIDDQIHDLLFHSASPPTVHQHILKSHGRDYAFIIVKSHALNAQDTPLLYFGEDITGYVIFPLSDLSDVQRVDVVVSPFPKWYAYN